RAQEPSWVSQIARANAWVKSYYLGVMLVFVALGLVFPQIGNGLRHAFDFHLPVHDWKYDFPTLSLTALMLSASIHTDVRDFRQLAQRPRVGGITLLMVYGVVPAITFLSTLLMVL